MIFVQENTYVDYEALAVKYREKKALKRTALSIGLSIIVFFASSFIFGAVLALVTGYLLTLAKTVEVYDIIYEAYIGLSYLLPMISAFIPVMLLVRIPLKVALPFKRTPIAVATPATLAGLGCSTVGVFIASVLLSFFQSAGFDYNVTQPEIPETMVGKLMYVFIIGVLPAIFEEFLFRGYMLQSLRRFGDVFAIIISSLIFALFHGNFAQLPNAFIMGVAFAFIAVRTGSIATGMVIHFINNSVITVLDIFLLSNLDEITSGMLTLVYLAVYFLFGVIGFVVLLAKFPKFFQIRKSTSPLSAGERAKAFFLQPVSLIGLILMFGMCFTYFVL